MKLLIFFWLLDHFCQESLRYFVNIILVSCFALTNTNNHNNLAIGLRIPTKAKGQNQEKYYGITGCLLILQWRNAAGKARK
jgi:uncharacterized membrane protein